jgi:transcriptional regulator with XRE-family HTH domain
MGSSRPETARLAEKLRTIRDSFGLSQAQMVERLKDQKLPAPLRLYAGNISRFEQGQREPPPLVLLAYARAAGIPLEKLVDANLDLPQSLIKNIRLVRRGTRRRGGEKSTKKNPKTTTKLKTSTLRQS